MAIEQPAGLIGVLLDKSARLDERDDAAIDLGKYDSPEALAALYQAATDPDEDDMVVGTAGESIGEIWTRTRAVDLKRLAQLRPAAQREIRALLQQAGLPTD